MPTRRSRTKSGSLFRQTGGRSGKAITCLIASGNVHIRYYGYTATSDRATYDRARDVATLEGNVVLTTARQTVYTDFVRLDRRHQVFYAREGRTVVPPDLIGPQITQALRLSGKTVERDGTNLVATDGLLTTCDFPNPHYKIGFSKATVIPNNRIVFRKAVIYRYDRAVLRLDYLTLPIRDEVRFSYLPLVGKTEEEGYFVKNALGYTLGSTLPGLLRLDYLQKKGIGLGFDQAYKVAEAAAGTAVLYTLYDRSRGTQNLNGRLNHQQRIDKLTLATISSDFQSNSYNALAQNSKTQNTTLSATRNQGPGSTTGSLTLGNSSQTGSVSRNVAYTLTQSERVGQTGNVTFRFNGADNSNASTFGATPFKSGTLQQSGDLHATGKIGLFDLDAAANRLFTNHVTGGTGGFYAQPDRLPDLTLTTDTARLAPLDLPLLGGLWKGVPMRFAIGYGRYIQQPKQTENLRQLFDLALAPRPIPLTPGGGLSLNLDGDYRQTVYHGDLVQGGTAATTTTTTAATAMTTRAEWAQYVLSQNTTLLQRINETSNFTVNYRYLRPYGATPDTFLFDKPGRQNSVATNLNLVSDRVKWSVGTGYDINEALRKDVLPTFPRSPWQTLSSQLALNPSAIFQTRFDVAYNINTGRLVTATNRFRIRGRNEFAVDTGLQYDPLVKKFSSITTVLQAPVFSRDLRLQALAGYNQSTKTFLYKNFTLTQSFHDYEFVFNYRDQPFSFLRSDRGFSIALRLKAFPVSQQPTTGRYGTALDTGTGEVF